VEEVERDPMSLPLAGRASWSRELEQVVVLYCPAPRGDRAAGMPMLKFRITEDIQILWETMMNQGKTQLSHYWAPGPSNPR